MKKVVACLCFALFALCIVLPYTVGGEGDACNYLRIHIRANSNAEADQAVKYEVRDAIVSYLTPVVASCESKAQAIERVGEQIEGAIQAANAVLKREGYSYVARASIRREAFPTRVYDGVTLSGGVYDALIVELGSGTGDNWWCVVYPPLCFSSGNGNVVYKSKIAEIIKNFFNK